MTETPSNSLTERPKKRRWLKWLLGGLLAVVALVAAAPYLVANSPLRDWLVARVAEKNNVHARVQNLAVGWFSPLELHGLQVESPYGEPILSVAEIRAERSWWQLALANQRLGTFVVEQPTVTLLASPSGWNFQDIGPPSRPGPSAPQTKRRPELTAEVHGAAVTLRRAGVLEPLLDVDRVNATARIRYTDGVRWLTVDPFRPLDHKRLTPEMCDNGLQLVAPVFAYATWAQGEISLSIDEFRLPLDRRSSAADVSEEEESPAALASGRLELHSVETGLKSPVLQAIADKLATLLGSKMPTRVRIADESTVLFELRGRRVHHEGLTFGLPEISPTLLIHSSGSVGLDKSLDLRIDVPIVVDLAFNGPVAQRLSGKTLRLAVTGTLDDPKVALPPGEGVWQQFANILSDEPRNADGVVADDVVELARDVLPAARETAATVVENLAETLDRIRERRAQRRALRNGDGANRNGAEDLANEGDLDLPGDASGDALPPPPPDDVTDDRRGQESDQDASEPSSRPRTGPLRRLFDRARRNRSE